MNIALGHLLAGERPDIVLSGINIGYNVSMPLVLSSGTVAGAIEGAAWGLRAAAFSLDLEQPAFEKLRHNNGAATGRTLDSLRAAAGLAAGFAETLLAREAPDSIVVHNFNFPCDCRADTPVESTEPADLRFRSLYAATGPGVFHFRWNEGEDRSEGACTDRAALETRKNQPHGPRLLDTRPALNAPPTPYRPMTIETTPLPHTRRRALFGLAEHVWDAEKGRWILVLKWKPIAVAVLAAGVAAYLAAAGCFYSLNRWQRDCEDTSYFEMMLFIFPDPVYGTKIHWAPEFVKTRVEAARESHRHKLSAVLFNRAKEAMSKQDWRNFFHYIFSASQLDPRNVEARILAAQAFFALRRDDDALDVLEEALPDLCDNSDYIREYVKACFLKEQDARLIGVAKYMLAKPDLKPQVRELLSIAIANAFFFRGEFAACEDTIKAAKLERTRDGFLLHMRVLWETGRHKEAIAMLEPVAMSSGQRPEPARHVDRPETRGRRHRRRPLLLVALPPALLRQVSGAHQIHRAARRTGKQGGSRQEHRRLPPRFLGQEAPMLLLCEYAADRGFSDTCEELMNEANKARFADAPRFQLLFIESHLKAGRYEETVSLVDKIFIDTPAWLPKYRQVFDCLRMVAQMSMNREDMSEIGFRKISESGEILPMPLMTMVAKKLVQVGRTDDAMRVINLAYERNGRTLSALNNVVDVHLASGGGPATPALIRRQLAYRRPTTEMLAKSRSTLAGDAFLFEPDREKLIVDLDTLLAGKPVLPAVPPTAPISKRTNDPMVVMKKRRPGKGSPF